MYARGPAPLVFLAALLAIACSSEKRAADDDVLVVFSASSLTKPLRAALDSFTEGEIQIRQQSGGSVEIARLLTERHRIPDIIALSDFQLFPQLLMPSQTSWYAKFARNRLVLMYSPRSRFASTIDSLNWWTILQQPGVRVGRSDPTVDPGGYRVLYAIRLAELHHNQPGLARRLLGDTARDVMMHNDWEVHGMLASGVIDYAWAYESVAKSDRMPYVALSREIDLSEQSLTSEYAKAVLPPPARHRKETASWRGAPIIYAFSVPRDAPHRALAERFAAFLLSPKGQAILQREHLDALSQPTLVGDSIPAALREPSRK